jgi:hypothetical protein
MELTWICKPDIHEVDCVVDLHEIYLVTPKIKSEYHSVFGGYLT